jgi:hypothetical protein
LPLKQLLVILALARGFTGPAVASALQPFSLICSGAAAGQSRPLQLDVHAIEGWHDSGLVQGEATYANRAEIIPDGIWLWLTGTLHNRRGVDPIARTYLSARHGQSPPAAVRPSRNSHSSLFQLAGRQSCASR